MFTFMEQTSRIDTVRRIATFLASIVAHAIALLGLIVLPMIFFGAIQADELISFVLAAPGLPSAPTPPTPPAPREKMETVRPVEKKDFTIPIQIPIGVLPPPDDDSPVDSQTSASSGVRGGSGVGPSLGILGSPLAPGLPAVSVPAPPPPAPPAVQKKEPVRRGGDVQASKLITKVDPVYPRLAVITRTSGVVILDVRVDEEGNVDSIRVMQGPSLLIEAAVSAVRQWKYSPTILNGEPVPVIATVTVIFNLR